MVQIQVQVTRVTVPTYDFSVAIDWIFTQKLNTFCCCRSCYCTTNEDRLNDGDVCNTCYQKAFRRQLDELIRHDTC